MNKKRTSTVIFHIMHTYPMLTLSALVAIAASVIVSLIPPLLLADIVDRLAAGENPDYSAALLYFAAIAISGVLLSARESFLIVFGQKITHGLRSEILNKMNHLNAKSFSQLDPGAFTARFSGDVDTVQTFFTSGIISMFADACRIIGIFLLILQRNRGLAIILCLILPLIFLFTRKVQKAMLQAQIGYRKAVSRVSNHVPESIRCIRTIHTLQKEQYMKDRYDDYISQAYSAMEKTNFFDSVYSPIILISNALVVALVMVMSSTGNIELLHFFGMSVGTSVAIINYISQIFGPIESLGMEIQTIQSAIAGLHRIDEFLEQEERWEIALDPAFDEAKGIELNSVDFGYDPFHPVLQNFNLHVAAGEKINLQGRTGAGKSTVFKLLLGLYQVQKGTVKIFGVHADQIPDQEKRRIFGYVDQNFKTIPGTVRDQISLKDPSVTDDMIEQAARLTGLSETIHKLEQGYETPCEPGLFSQGQWQLLSIARAIVTDPRILLLDEITANLDSDTESKVLRAIEQAAQGRTVISISHRINPGMNQGAVNQGAVVLGS